MIIEEVISKKEWNSYIINGSYNIQLSSVMALEQMLTESASIIYENNIDVINYRNFIDFEKSYTVSYDKLVPGNLYFPINYRGAPFQQTIILDIPKNNSKFINSDNNTLYFSRNRKKLEFAKSNPNSKGTIETLIFKNKPEAENHILTLKLKFSDWDIKIRYL
jgi:hypothetical protein